MLPNRNIFRSRRKALFWAAIVCVTALQVAGGSKHHDGDIDTDAALGEAVMR